MQQSPAPIKEEVTVKSRVWVEWFNGIIRFINSHHTNHEAGGNDVIKLDDLGEPDDNTDLDSSITAHGLLPKLSGDVDEVLKGDGTWGAGYTPPTGTGFVHVTSGVQDAAAKLVDTADINNSQVTFAKIQDISTARLLGRTTAGTGVVEQISVGSGLTLAAGILSGTGGTVTSVGVAGANGIGVSGSPITSSGTINLSLGNITPSGINISSLTADRLLYTNGSKDFASAGLAGGLSLSSGILQFTGMVDNSVVRGDGTTGIQSSGAYVNDSSQLSVGTTTAKSMITAIGGTGLSTGLLLSDNASASTTKEFRLHGNHVYSESNYYLGIIRVRSNTANNTMYLGGNFGVTDVKALTEYEFYTAANVSTDGGTLALYLNHSDGLYVTNSLMCGNATYNSNYKFLCKGNGNVTKEFVLDSYADPASPFAGSIWHSSSRKSHCFMTTDGIKAYNGGNIYNRTVNITWSNTTTEFGLMGSAATFPANFFVVGKRVNVTCVCVFGTLVTDSLTIRLKISSSTASTFTLPLAAHTADNLKVFYDILCSATGAGGNLCISTTYILETAGVYTCYTDVTDFAIDTTVSHVMSVSEQFSVANVANTITCKMGWVDVI